ncbi:MAG: ribonuclease R [Defluviitaleaceae bacterium]|nr:ribonuclease R [Defluviitaleaceae bacterium]
MKKNKSNIIVGKFIGNERGFGFVMRNSRDAKHGADIFIPPHLAFGALNGDEVVVELDSSHIPSKSSYSQIGKVIEIRSRLPMVGTFYTDGHNGFVKPIDAKNPHTFFVPPKTMKRFVLADGMRVYFSIEKKLIYDNRTPNCFITEVIGHMNDPGMDVLTLVANAGVPYEFSTAVNEEAAAVPMEVSESEAENRRDLREEYIITIDGDDTKDIDDAISFRQNEDGTIHLGVHIADVTHYVRENTALDTSALTRGTSIYLADRVIPMLPHKLSSGICSLFPDVDRLTLSCIMTVDSGGNVIDHEITQSIIRSKKRFTYNEVEALIDTDTHFQQMDNLREILYAKRNQRGALDFDIPEAKIRVDEEGHPISIEQYARTRATGIIEEFMILCNETIAAHFFAKKVPFIYRTHEAPSKEKIATLRLVAKNLGVTITNADSLQRVLDITKDTPAATAISTAVLQAMPQAHYTTVNPTHFGLASEAYCHFTSPIRRYADLQIHRIIKKQAKNIEEQLPEICSQCSRTERTAEALEREVTDLKKVQFMANKKGRRFKATVSGVTSWGIYVMLSNTVEGLVTTANLRQNGYTFNKEKNIFENKRQGKSHIQTDEKCLSHGTSVKVRLVRINEEERKLTFVLF